MTEQAVRRSPRPDRPGSGFATRRRPAVPRRRRLVRLGLASALCVALGGGAWWMLNSAAFAVTRVQSGSYRFTAKAELDSVLSLFLGRNIWTLREQDVAAALQGLDWVRDLHVIRRLPGTIEVDFREWRPLAVLALPDGGDEAWADTMALADAAALSDSAAAGAPAAEPLEDPLAEPEGPILVFSEDGRVLPFPRDLVLPALPTLVGLAAGPGGILVTARADSGNGAPGRDGPSARAEVRPADRAEEAAGPQVLALFAAVEDAGLEALCPVDFVVAGPDGYAIVLQERQGTLLVGREDFTARLRRYMFAREHLEPGAQVDLRFADRVTVKVPPEEPRQDKGPAAGQAKGPAAGQAKGPAAGQAKGPAAGKDKVRGR